MSNFIIGNQLLDLNNRLISAIGEEAARPFIKLYYRIVLGIEETPREFYSKQRSLGLEDPRYLALQTYRKSMSLNHQMSRMWRPIYAFLEEQKFQTVEECAAYFKVCPNDMRMVIKHWESEGKPCLLDTYNISNRDCIDREVLVSNVEPTERIWIEFRDIANRLINNEKYRWIHKQGFMDEETLLHDCLTAGIHHYMNLDFQNPKNRSIFCKQRMNQHMLDIVKACNAKKRSRNERYVENGEQIFQKRVFSFEELNFDGAGEGKVEAYRDNSEQHILSDVEYLDTIEHLRKELTPNEFKIVYSLLVDVDEEIEQLLEGEDLGSWTEWVCEQLEVSYSKLQSKLKGAFSFGI